MYALQRALKAADVPWLKIGGTLQPDEIPWVWCWLDIEVAIKAQVDGRQFIIGPNVLFKNSREPGKGRGERFFCDASQCRLLVTESQWYKELIEANRGPRNTAPVAVWPYPIDPMPEGPLPAKYDLLIYHKSDYGAADVGLLRRVFPQSIEFRYGKYARADLIAAARQSRCCAYLSDDDRGPLALAEIMLCGCPAAGIPRGAPWIIDGLTGYLAAGTDIVDIVGAVERARAIDRESVRDIAMGMFMPAAVAGQAIECLRSIL
jgi:hypothetical protein